MKLTFVLKGGAGSGNHGHKGRPGFVGGSTDDGIGGVGPGNKVPATEAPAKSAKSTNVREIQDAVFGIDSAHKGVPALLLKPDHNPYSYAVEYFAKQPDVFTFARGYYYRSGEPQGFAAHIESELKANGFEAEIIGSGDHYYQGFVGGAATLSARSSFFWTVMRVKKLA